MNRTASVAIAAALALALAVGLTVAGPSSESGSIVDLWSSVKAPPAPELKPVQLSPKRAALLVLDIEKVTTNMERRPRAVASVPRLNRLLAQAREKGMPVLHSTTARTTAADILPDIKPLPTEPVVSSSVDKFHNTDLEKLLRERKVEQVLIVGTAAEGAVMHTAIGAVMRSFDVVVPVDGMSSASLYAEQYVAWHLLNSPGARGRVTLTRLDMIRFAE